MLSQVIRFYGDALQGTLTSYLERSFGLFVEQQTSMREQLQSVTTADPLSFMRDMTEKNLSMWKEMQDSFLGNATPRENAPQTDSDRKKS